MKSTLKTDRIAINVTDVAHFTSELKLQNLTLGEPYEWYLPDIEEGQYAFSEVIVEPKASIIQSILFSTSENKFSYDG